MVAVIKTAEKYYKNGFVSNNTFTVTNLSVKKIVGKIFPDVCTLQSKFS